MKLYFGVTDNDWYRFLSQLPNVDEVNFWQPGGSSQFRALQPGELFLFKLHAPENFIAGGGFYTHSSLLPVSLAWEAFGQKNGATSFVEMRSKIMKYRRATDPSDDFKIGCILLQKPFFFPRTHWIPVPDDFPLNIPGKSYDIDSGTGKEIWEEVQLRVHGTRPMQVAELQEMFGTPGLIRRRLGQGSFRILVTDTYQKSCAVTREKALPALEAAHIQPVTQEGKHRIDNGLLLRSDIHRLFDAGYVTVTPDYKFRASRKLKDDFDNGENYFRFDDSPIWLPRDTDCRPNREFLEWHAGVKFRG